MEMEKLFQYKNCREIDNYEILFKSLRRMEIERIWRDDPIFWECRVLHAAQFPGVSDARYCSRNKETFILEKN